MSIITVQIGQCGNQIGHSLFSNIYSDASRAYDRNKVRYAQNSLQRFFRPSPEAGGDSALPVARAVLVDAECKVINSIQNRTTNSKQQWLYPKFSDEKSIKHGSGNNWAMGYNKNGNSLLPSVLEKTRLEAEKCDGMDGFLLLMSAAGGTGSGLGTRIAETLRDDYPKHYILSQLTLPFMKTKDVVIQDYNLLFSLTRLYKCSDAILLMQNDHLYTICSQTLGLDSFSLNDMNQVASHMLGSILQPSLNYSSSEKWEPPHLILGNLISHLCLDPTYKLLSARSVPLMRRELHAYSSYTFESLIKNLRQMLITNSPIDTGMLWSHTKTKEHFRNSILSNYLFIRGKDCESADSSLLTDSQLYSSVLSNPGAILRYHPHNYNTYERSCTVVSNDQLHIATLMASAHNAWRLFNNKAYIHHYIEQGLSEDDFLNSLILLEQLIHDYNSIKP